MLGTFLKGASAAGGYIPLSITYLGVSQQTANTFTNGTRTYTSPTITLTSSETLLIATGNQSSTSDWNWIDDATIGGSSAVKVVSSPNPGGFTEEIARMSTGIFYISGLTVTDSTVSVSVNYLGSDVFRSICQFYKLDSASITVQQSFDSYTDFTNRETTLNADPNWVLFCAGSAYSQDGTTLLTGTDEQYHQASSEGGLRLSSGFAENIATATHTFGGGTTATPVKFVTASFSTP